jgi:hypothetical protein
VDDVFLPQHTAAFRKKLAKGNNNSELDPSRLKANHYETRAYKQFMTTQLSHLKRVSTEVLGETVLPFASRGTWADTVFETGPLIRSK